MAGEWRDLHWGDIATLEYGKSLRSYEEQTASFRVYGTNGPIGWHDKPLSYEAGVIIGRKGANRGIHFSPEPFFVIDTAFYLKRKTEIDFRWAYYCLLTYDINGMDSGSAIPSTSRDDFYALRVKVPPLHEQQAIACILGALDDKIELNRRRNRTLESMARAIFQSWFIDFDPVKAKAAGQNPHGLKPEIASLFPDACEESEFGDIPRGWRIGKIDEIAYINAKTLGRGDALDFIDYVEISEVMRGEISMIKRYNRGEEPSRARRRLQHGDTVLSTVRPDRGAYFLALNPIDSLIASTGFVVLTPKAGNWAFLHAFTTREEFCKELGRLADGGAYPAIRPEVVGDRQITIPNEATLIRAFEKIAQELYFRSEKCKIENRTLISLRDALIPKLISGELRVPDAERIVGRCV